MPSPARGGAGRFLVVVSSRAPLLAPALTCACYALREATRRRAARTLNVRLARERCVEALSQYEARPCDAKEASHAATSRAAMQHAHAALFR
jgi:hypothetical protein